MQNIVKFEDKEIELVTIDGVPMMTLSQIVTALDASPNQATQLYNRHADEFTPDMTRKKRLTTESARIYPESLKNWNTAFAPSTRFFYALLRGTRTENILNIGQSHYSRLLVSPPPAQFQVAI